MRILSIMLVMALLACGTARAEEGKPSLVIYIHPNEYSHQVRLGLVPVYIIWARNGPALERAARKSLQPHFSEIDLCHGSNSADVVVWLKPELSFNALAQTYYAAVTAQFYRADTTPIGTLKATGSQLSSINSRLVDEHVQMAYEDAMRQIAAKFAADSALQQAIDSGVGKSPCAMVPLVPNPVSEAE